jgi:hypothetical protein
MRGHFVLAALSVCLLSTPAKAQTATAVGVGTGISSSKSQSQAVAIGGGNANGGSSASSVTIATNPANTFATVNNTGTATVRNVPSVFAPGLAAAGLETCLGSVSGGGAFVGTGFTFGTSIPDPGCATRLDARTLWSMGLKKAAVARLCINPDIARSMPEVCARYLPQPVAYAAPSPLSPLNPFANTFAATEPSQRGGAIMLIDGNTGKERLCNIYANGQQKCLAWADEQRPPRMKVAVAKHHTPKPTPARMIDPPPADAPKAAAVGVIP